jgi:hypothetical protein
MMNRSCLGSSKETSSSLTSYLENKELGEQSSFAEISSIKRLFFRNSIRAVSSMSNRMGVIGFEKSIQF